MKEKSKNKPKYRNAFINSLRRTNKLVLMIFIFIVLYLAIYESILTEIPAPNQTFYSLGKAGKVFIEILYSIITGLILYFFIDFMPRDRKRVAVHFILLNGPTLIEMNSSSMINELAYAAGKVEGDNITMENFRQICGLDHIRTFNYYSWKWDSRDLNTFIKKNCEQIEINVNNLLSFNEILDKKWVRCIVAIQQNLQGINSFFEGDRINQFHVCAYYIWNLNMFSRELKKLSSDVFPEYFNEHIKTYGVQKKLGDSFIVTKRII
jgi:hypothetical protein